VVVQDQVGYQVLLEHLVVQDHLGKLVDLDLLDPLVNRVLQVLLVFPQPTLVLSLHTHPLLDKQLSP
jgi:hypothetical protein